MAHEFAAFAVPDEHVTFLQLNPGLVHDYLDGAAPGSGFQGQLPDGWPAQPPESLGSWGINHRNTDLYHWILNGGPALVTGAGSIFQTWYEPDRHSALKLDDTNERFAFRASQLPELRELVATVSVASVLAAFRAWCESQGKSGDDLDEYACEPFVDEFTAFGEGIDAAIAKGHGLVW